MKGERKSKHSLMSIFMAAAGLVLVSRLFVLTVAEAGKWRSAVEDMSVRAVYETAPRGDILDMPGADRFFMLDHPFGMGGDLFLARKFTREYIHG